MPPCSTANRNTEDDALRARLRARQHAGSSTNGSKAQAPDSLPAGPAIWICGDCHLGNLGPIANLQGGVEIQIRDLDQTVIGNPAHDLIRLGLSLAMAARGSDLPGVTTAVMLEQLMEGYCAGLAGAAGDGRGRRCRRRCIS